MPTEAAAQTLQLHNADYVVIVFYFLFMTLIGWVFKRFVKNTSDYFRGGGEMLWWICGAGAFMTSFSAVTFTGMAGKAYVDGPIVLVIFIGNAVGFLVNYLWFAPVSRQTRAVTAMEVVRARFGRVNELFFTWLQIPVGTFYAGLWLVGLAKFVSAGFGWDMNLTIVITGVVVLFMALLGGSWSVMAGDFVQMLVLMPVTVVVAVMSLVTIGGPAEMVAKTPSHFWQLNEVASWWFIVPWVVLTLVQKLISTNSMNDCSRYLSVKDSRHARWAALLGFVLFIVGPALWFIPPLVARVLYPDLQQLFPKVKVNAHETAYFAMAVTLLPAGMTGLLISGIFGATMSSMDGGLNKNAGFFVKNFYQPYLKPQATERELMFVSKATTTVLGLLVIAAAWTVGSQPNLTIFEAMTWFGGLVGVPTSVPLVLGMIFRKAPGWAGWSTALVGMACSLVVANFFSAEDMTRLFGWQMNEREASDWVFSSGTLINITIPVAWFFLTGIFGWDRKPASAVGPEPMTLAEVNKLPERQRIDALFTIMKKPVDFHSEEGGPGSDNRQAKIMGILCLIYGSFVSLLIVLPTNWTGRIIVVFCAGVMLLIGWGLWRAGTKASRMAAAQS